MTQIVVPMFANSYFPDLPWAELFMNRPMHPSDLLGAVRWLLRQKKSFLTLSRDVLLAVSFLIRKGEVHPGSVQVVVYTSEESSVFLGYYVDGELDGPWPQPPERSIFRAHLEYYFPE